MVIYIVVFCFSTLILLAINKWKTGSLGFIFWSIATILCLSLLAGLRASSVGTDTAGYALPLYEIASSKVHFADFYASNWFRIWRYSDVSSFEIGYLAIIWLSSRIGSFQVQLFLTSILTICPIYIAFVKKKYFASLPLAMFMFMFIEYNSTLNGMRQWIALSFVLLAIWGYYNPNISLLKQIKVIILLLIAVSFHTSAILGVFVLIVRWFLSKGSVSARVLIVVGICLALVVCIGVLRQLIVAVGLEQYLNYLGSGSVRLVPSALIIRLPFLLFAIYLYRSDLIEKHEASFYLTIMILSILLSQLASLGTHSGRIGLYFDIFQIPMMALIVKRVSLRDASLRAVNRIELCTYRISFAYIVSSAFSIVYSLVYWIYYYAILNNAETIPYLFFWQ